MNEYATNPSVEYIRRALLWSIATLAFATLAVQLEFVSVAHADDAKPRFMFVHTSDDLAVEPDANTLRLVKVNQQILYFSDRPDRIAGHLAMADYLQEWDPGPPRNLCGEMKIASILGSSPAFSRTGFISIST